MGSDNRLFFAEVIMAVDQDDFYQERILDHYEAPFHRGHCNSPTHRHRDKNPLCGDIIQIELSLDDQGKIRDVYFDGDGCCISQASASMMTERLKGRSISEALALDATFTRMLHGDADAAADEELGDLRALAGVAQFPVRVKCALLAWNCLEELVGPGS